MDGYVEVYIASDIAFAYLMKASLENAGIPVQIENENLYMAHPFVGAMYPRVLVPSAHEEQAKRIIEEIQQPSQNDRDADEQEQ